MRYDVFITAWLGADGDNARRVHTELINYESYVQSPSMSKYKRLSSFVDMLERIEIDITTSMPCVQCASFATGLDMWRKTASQSPLHMRFVVSAADVGEELLAKLHARVIAAVQEHTKCTVVAVDDFVKSLCFTKTACDYEQTANCVIDSKDEHAYSVLANKNAGWTFGPRVPVAMMRDPLYLLLHKKVMHYFPSTYTGSKEPTLTAEIAARDRARYGIVSREDVRLSRKEIMDANDGVVPQKYLNADIQHAAINRLAGVCSKLGDDFLRDMRAEAEACMANRPLFICSAHSAHSEYGAFRLPCTGEEIAFMLSTCEQDQKRSSDCEYLERCIVRLEYTVSYVQQYDNKKRISQHIARNRRKLSIPQKNTHGLSPGAHNADTDTQ